ncbi:MAG: branched-chain amino acid ABC transporter permease [Clostridiales bacterium]|nr:branched-chain amino acid ABC transporter permease [Clostridiales bacterium]
MKNDIVKSEKKSNITGSSLLIRILVVVGIYALVSALMLTGNMSRSWESLSIRICFNVILALSLNLVVGFLGELSLGHAGFYAVGAYAGSMFAVYTDFPMFVRIIGAVLVGALSAGIAGFLISSSILKLKGDYLAIVTLAFGEIIRSFVKILPGTGGTAGLSGIPAFPSRYVGFTFAYAFVILTLIILKCFINSRHGRAVTAIRDNVISAEMLGININRYKVTVFVIASVLAGVAGVIFSFFKTMIEPNDFSYNLSIEILVMVVIGGMGNLTGSIIAAGVIVVVPELLRALEDYRMLMYAIVLIAVMLINESPKKAQFIERYSPKVLLKKLLRKGEKKSESA